MKNKKQQYRNYELSSGNGSIIVICIRSLLFFLLVSNHENGCVLSRDSAVSIYVMRVLHPPVHLGTVYL